jgi:hypothetical protein
MIIADTSILIGYFNGIENTHGKFIIPSLARASSLVYYQVFVSLALFEPDQSTNRRFDGVLNQTPE